jgi:hypothetical protein
LPCAWARISHRINDFVGRNYAPATGNASFEDSANFVRRVIPVQISGDLEKPQMNAIGGIRTTIE